MTSLALLLVPAGAAHALGLGGVFSDAVVEIDLVKQSKDEAVIDVSGTEYSGESLEIALNPSGYVGSGTRSTFIKSVSYDPDGAEDWTYRFTLDAAQIAQLDPGTSYQMMTMRDNGRDVLASGDTETAKIPFDFDQLAQPDPEPSPTTPRKPSEGGGSSGGGTGGSTSGGASGGTSGGDSGKSGGSEEKGDEEAEKGPWTAPEKPPTTKGIDLGGADERSVDADDVIHASASGFKPNETGIRVVVYSSPIVLSTSVKANGHGVAKWSGRLPKDIGLGKHTLTFQGSVNRGIQFVVTGTPADGECAEGGCAKTPVSETPSAASAGDKPSTGWLTWLIVAVMICLAAVAGAVAMLSGRRRSGSKDWDERHYDQAPPRYADPAAYAYQQPGEHPSRHRAPQAHLQPAPPQPSHRGGPREPDQRLPGQRQAAPRQPLQRQPLQRQPGPRQQEPRQQEPRQQEPREPAPQQAAHRQPRPPESFAPPQQRAEAFAPWR
ncbi:MAG: hypothetical protein ACRDPS_13740 [Nocardioides sp.]|uniref:hypothetical protein n=1 Tax=Nocardioides sp. TaxID=35761 RepID=UPI003D6C0C65